MVTHGKRHDLVSGASLSLYLEDVFEKDGGQALGVLTLFFP